MTNLELRRQRRSSMLAIPERISLAFAKGDLEMRAKPNGTGGTAFEFNGYAATFNDPFDMWDPWGDPYTESVEPGAFSRTLANKADVAFLIGHNDAGILMARTKSGTMRLGQDTRGLPVNVPSMDGSRDDVRALASAVERGDMDEMSCAFVTRQQAWDDKYEHRRMLEMDLNRGDVSAVVFGANPHTNGSSMVALPAESLTLRRPVSVRMPTAPYTAHAGEGNACPQCQSANDGDAYFCDQCGAKMGQPGESTVTGEDETQQCQSCLCMNATDAKFCDQCGSSLAGNRPYKAPGGGYVDEYGSGRPADRRGAFQVDATDGPDYDPQPHADAAGQLVCPHGSCTDGECAAADVNGSPAKSCKGGCTVTGGAMNGPDAKHCDQCSGSLYSEDGTIILGDSGIPEELEGGEAMALSRQAALELRKRQLQLLKVSA